MRCAVREADGPCGRRAAVVVNGGVVALLMCDEHGRDIVRLAGDGHVTARFVRRQAPRSRPA